MNVLSVFDHVALEKWIAEGIDLTKDEARQRFTLRLFKNLVEVRLCTGLYWLTVHKRQVRDIDGMDQIVDRPKEQDVEPNIKTQAVLARHYISVGLQDKVETLLKEMEAENIKQDSCGKLNKVDEVENFFEAIIRKWKLSSKTGYELLKVYANHKMLMKGKDLIKHMTDGRCQIGQPTWDAIVTLNVQAEEVEKIDFVLPRAA
ncbi:hypothetical protein DEO72_LG10g2860 [Vigna unguiculata]|uniref:Uncharacterized protein n=1 Tax=Vigna unguiculata TaxID=3917 RepID=A0A4D6NHK7_VIGUN|nr:hypothetical protein DEO72_LG10g2860 [Vigna unguiculata]